jgi:hypothetical protein
MLQKPTVIWCAAAGMTYAKHLKQLAAEDPQSFICHYYNYYFAHTAGGRMIGKKVRQSGCWQGCGWCRTLWQHFGILRGGGALAGRGCGSQGVGAGVGHNWQHLWGLRGRGPRLARQQGGGRGGWRQRWEESRGFKAACCVPYETNIMP